MPNNTKKLLIIGASQGLYGGIEAYMFKLMAAACQWPEFEVKLCFKLVSGAKLNDDLVQMAKEKNFKAHYVKRASSKLINLIKWANIVHVQNVPPDIIFPARLLGKTILSSIHNRRMNQLNFHNLIWGITVKIVNKRWYNSHFVWNTWEPNEKSSNSECVPTICELPQTYCTPIERKGFIFIGRWIPNKGIEELLKAYALNDFNEDEWPLTILGDGPLKPRILRLIDELGLKNINLPGFVSDKTKENLLSSAKWLLAPANTQEDLGLTPIEARNVGVPSIVTNDGGLPESGGPSALLAKPGNVEDLANCMNIASTMKIEDYLNRSELARVSLKGFLKPMEFYRKMYNVQY